MYKDVFLKLENFHWSIFLGKDCAKSIFLSNEFEDLSFEAQLTQKIKFGKIAKNHRLRSLIFILNQAFTMPEIDDKTSFFLCRFSNRINRVISLFLILNKARLTFLFKHNDIVPVKIYIWWFKFLLRCQNLVCYWMFPISSINQCGYSYFKQLTCMAKFRRVKFWKSGYIEFIAS